ncbi:hypothetical protein ACQPW1_17170 [Nocardia sp. CA-128927]|uniref:hypothetical protein n=1 Tax=Nocardia sp. CA-128927 TaxID=3239975 RepID=UPI003D976C71
MVWLSRIQAFEGGFIEFFDYMDDEASADDHDIPVIGSNGNEPDKWPGTGRSSPRGRAG